MDALDPIARPDFLKLIERGERQLDNQIEAGQIIYWGQPKREQREHGKRYRRNFIAIDAVLVALADLFEEGGPHRLFPLPKAGIVIVLSGMQLVLPRGVDIEDAQMIVGLEERNFTVACYGLAELEEKGYLNKKSFLRSFRMPVRYAVQRVRNRARTHGIRLPARFAPPPSELPLAAQGGLPWTYPLQKGRTVQLSPIVEMPLQIPNEDIN